MNSEKNKTLIVRKEEHQFLLESILKQPKDACTTENIMNKIILGDTFHIAHYLPSNFVDLLILDPPYNLSKNFGKIDFKKTNDNNYNSYIDTILSSLMHTLKNTASVYICGDWLSSTSLYLIARRYFYIHNRITWQREKGRGAKKNWKNAHEDIWFCTKSRSFVFHGDDVKIRRKVIAPYRHNGAPKDWQETDTGNYRDTHPSNFWDDITIPYWSMPENTEHPTQKPEKLIAKLILASSNKADMVLDPFVGSGTSCVVAKKLHRNYVGIEIDEHYACVSQKRLNDAIGSSIQGYSHGVFWERNTHAMQSRKKERRYDMLNFPQE